MTPIFRSKWLQSARMLLLLPPLLLTACGGGPAKSGTATPTATASSSAMPTESAEATPVPSAPDASPSETPPASETASPPSAGEPTPMAQVTALRLIDFQSGWAGGIGWIARTDDGGKSWQLQYEGDGEAHQLFALNGQQAWATLNTDDPKRYPLLRTSDGGEHWEAAGDVPNGGFLHFVSDREAFSAHTRTTDGGKTWTSLPVPDGIVGDAYYRDSRSGWAVTQSKGQFHFVHTSDGGKTWIKTMTRAWDGEITGTTIRSTGKNDAWIQLNGGHGMTQQSYSLFHTSDGGQKWKTVVANGTAGGGPAPGFKANEKDLPTNAGNSPGTLYVASPSVAFLSGQCQACDKSNTMGHTTDGGGTWINGKDEFAGYGTPLVAAVDAKHVWWIVTDAAEASVMYASSDGGAHWTKAHTFEKPRPAEK
ncbi:hypothetical protein [Cohnella sp. REN36]|uniref:hypothetical protein n=1 Tax=Cohnella sp. REN36 TaxID=2887347 RepID=UPI001D13E743|nr:hypothetical protein [Cohnella sp. REN36]MCC3374790.1 hypothetical protein [Cohnella sp. REN36]